MKPNKILSTIIVALLAISMFALVVPKGSAAAFTLTVDAAYHDQSVKAVMYEKSVTLTPAEQHLHAMTVGVYQAASGAAGGTKKDTPNTYTLNEGTNYDIKFPISATGIYGGNTWTGLFEHLEVVDTAGTPELTWPSGVYYKAVYTDGAVRTTKLIVNPLALQPRRVEIAGNLEARYMRSSKELLDRSDGVLEPYLKFRFNNPVGGGAKTIMAVYYMGWGPETEHMYWKVVRSPDATRLAFQNKDIDLTFDLIRTIDIDTLAPISVITSTPGFHMCYIGFNLRLNWLAPQSGGEPGFSLRKAIAHLIPKDSLIATLFKYIVVRLDSWLPPSLGEWYEPGGTIYDYNPTAAYNTLIAGGWTYDAGLGTWKHGTDVAGGADSTIQFMSPLYEVAPTSFTIALRVVEEMNALKNPSTGAATPIKAEHAPLDFWQIVERAFYLHTFEMYFLCWGLSRFPSILYGAYHSDNDIEWGDNAWGLHNNALDAQLAIVEFGLDHSLKVAAAKQAQIMLSNLLPNIPIYSRNYFNAHQKDFYGVVLQPGDGTDQFWSYMEAKGNRQSPSFKTTATPHAQQIDGNMTIWHNGETHESYNPAQVSSVYANRVVFGNIYDGLMANDPYSLADEPWLAKSWNTVGPWTGTTPHGVSVTNGQYTEFILDDRVVEGKVLWHDGTVFDATDILESWDYTWKHQLTNFFGFWQFLVDINSPSPDKVVAYWTKTSQWLVYDAAGAGAIFEKEIWKDYVTGVLGLTTDAQIRTFAPQGTLRSTVGAYPASAAFPWLTCSVGTAQYVLHDVIANGYGTNLYCFDLRAHTTIMPTLHYWKTKAEIKEPKIEYFYHLGEATLDGEIDIGDLAKIGIAYGKRWPGYPAPYPVPPYSYGGFRQEDIVHDGAINIIDVATAGKNYGKAAEY